MRRFGMYRLKLNNIVHWAIGALLLAGLALAAWPARAQTERGVVIAICDERADITGLMGTPADMSVFSRRNEYGETVCARVRLRWPAPETSGVDVVSFERLANRVATAHIRMMSKGELRDYWLMVILRAVYVPGSVNL